MPSPEATPRMRADTRCAARLTGVLEDALLGRERGGRHAVPSAGALYPYEFGLNCRGDGRSDPFGPFRLSDLADVLPVLGALPMTALSLSLTFRPTVSTAKYGERGLIYGLQDCGHLAASVAIAARRAGFGCTFRRHGFTDAFAASRHRDDGVLILEATIGPEATSGRWAPAGVDLARLDRAMRMRRSAKAFTADTPPPTRLTAMLASARALHPHVRDPGETWNAHLLVRDGQDAFSAASAEAQGDLAVAGPRRAPAALDPVSLFCGQRFASHAGAILFFSDRLDGWQASLEQGFAAGKLGQCLYLAAAMQGLAACCVGGFDYGLAARVLALPDDRYASYAMLFGFAGAGPAKVDRNTRPTPRPAPVPFPFRELEAAHARPDV